MAQSEEASRLNAAELFRQTGVFFWVGCLEQLSIKVAPARAVYAIGYCLRSVADEPSIPTSSPGALRTTVMRLLSEHRQTFERETLDSVMERWGPPDTRWWNARKSLGHLMAVECGGYMLKNTRRRLQEHGVRVDYPELHDLAAMFANDHLPNAVRSFDPARGEGKEGAWVTTVFFRYALPRVVALGRARASFEMTFDIPDPAGPPDAVIERQQTAELEQRLFIELKRLPPYQRQAIECYFGLDDSGRERTLAEVACKLDRSVHMARLALTTGLGTLVHHLVEPDRVGKRSNELARLFFEERLSADEVAARMKVSTDDVRNNVQDVGRTVRSALRSRTMSSQTSLDVKRERSLNALTEGTKVSEAALQSALVRLVETVETHLQQARRQGGARRLSSRDGGPLPLRVLNSRRGRQLEVRERNDWMTVGLLPAIQHELGKRLDLYGRLEVALQDAGADDLLADIFAPTEVDIDELDSPDRRSDLPEERHLWERALERAAGASRTGARTIVQGFLDEYSHKDRLHDPDSETMIERVRASLSGVAADLDESLPWALRAGREALLGVWAIDGSNDIHCAWIDANGEPLEAQSLLETLEENLDLVGKFDGEQLDALAAVAAQAILRGEASLPGFEVTGADRRGRQVLRWAPSVLELREPE